MTSPTPLPRLLTVDLAERLGVSRSRSRTELRRGNWQRFASGVLLTRPDPPTRDDWADLGVALAGPSSAISGWDAARARGLGARRPPEDRVLVVSPTAMNRVFDGVRVRRTTRPYRITTQGLHAPLAELPIVHLARAVTDTALQQHRDASGVRALVTSAVAQRRCSLSELMTEFQAGPRRNSAALRAALSDTADGARSVAESTACRRLARGPVPPFELNVPVVDEHGSLLYVVDELWRELRAAVEMDSREFHFSEHDWERTLARHNDLTRWGLAVTHYPPKTVTRRGSTFVPDVADWLGRRAAELGVPVPSGRGVRRPRRDGTPEPFVVVR